MAGPVKKVTVNLPAKLLDRAQATTGLGITETIVRGLEEIERRHKLSALRGLRGSIRLELDLEKTRR